MKHLFLLFGLSAISVSTFAQQNSQHSHTGDKFGVSVFHKSHLLTPISRADIGTDAKLSAQFPTWMIGTDQWTGGFKELNGKPMNVPGATLLEKAKNLMKNQLAVVGIKAEDWKLDHQLTNDKGFTFLYFYQEVAGQKVAFAKMHFRFTQEGKIARINMTGYGNPDLSLTPSIGLDKALDIATADMKEAVMTQKSIDKNLVWFPIPSEKGYTLHPAYKFSVEGTIAQSSSIPLNLFGYVDAITGNLLYRDNETKDAIDLKVVGSVFVDGYLNPAKSVGLPYVTAKIGTATTLLANDTGFFRSATLPLPSTATVTLEGPWSKVRSAPHSNATPSFSKTITALGGSDSFKSTGIASRRHLNAYYHVNTVHDHMKKMYGTSFTGMDYALATNVDVTGTCNAFFTSASGSSINFYPAGGGCESFAEIRDVVYHEYGHAIVSKMYTGGMANGGLNEGQADVWGMSITGDSILARGSSTGAPGSYIRRYDVGYKVYPRDLIGEVHADGEIIAGAWWDYCKNVGSKDSMAKLFAETLLNEKPDGANGTEGAVYYEMLIGALVNDDNDANLSNGTPHMPEIVKAFAKHGIYLLQDVKITHNEIDHQPAGTAIKVTATATVSNPMFFKELNLVYRNRTGTWITIPMVDAGGYNFSATIPAQSGGTIVDYYFSAVDIVNVEGVFGPANYFPIALLAENRVTLNYQFAVGVAKKTTIDFESTLNPDWSLGISTDNASTGVWVQVKPIATSNSGLLVQTGNDHTSGSGQCLVTGNSSSFNAYTQSVKSGTTTVLSPFFDLTGYTNPIVEYYRWFSNDRGRNPKKEIFRAQMSAGSTFFYKDVDNTNQSDHQWRRRVFNPNDIFPGATKMQLKFIATETIPVGSTQNGLVEAAIDDIVIYESNSISSGINNVQQELAQIYPNPATDFINVILPANAQQTSIQFYDITGKLLSQVNTQKGKNNYQIDTKSMTPGQYMLVISMDKTIQTRTITINR